MTKLTKTPACNMVLPKAELNGPELTLLLNLNCGILLSESDKTPAFGNTQNVVRHPMTNRVQTMNRQTKNEKPNIKY